MERLSPKISDQDINELIKQVAEKAKIKGTVLYSITKGGKRQDHYLKKWQMVSNHTARRTFITNLLLNKVSETFVKKLTGIKSASTLARYNKMTTEDAAEIMSQHKFFK
jgi:integrase